MSFRQEKPVRPCPATGQVRIRIGLQRVELGVSRGVAKSGAEHEAICTVLVRIADQAGALQMKIFSHLAHRRDGYTLSSVFEVKKEIPADMLLHRYGIQYWVGRKVPIRANPTGMDGGK